MDDLISRQAAIDALEEHLDYLQTLNKNENPTAENKWYGVNWARNTIADLPSAEPTHTNTPNALKSLDCISRQDDFEKQIHAMFDHIWDCEIDHPVFQDTVGDLMEAVIQCHKRLPSAQSEKEIPYEEGCEQIDKFHRERRR